VTLRHGILPRPALAGQWGALLVVLLLGSLPLLGQNATGSGMELLNSADLVVAALGGAPTCASRSHPAFGLVLGAVLLGSRGMNRPWMCCRGVIILIGWWRARGNHPFLARSRRPCCCCHRPAKTRC